jgi:hypothetical protein
VSWRLGAFALSLTVLQFGFPITQYGTVWNAVYLLLYAAMVLFGIMVVRAERERLTTVVGIAAVFLGCAVWFTLDPDSATATLWMFIAIGAFQLSLGYYLLKFVFRPSDASGPELLFAAVCVYLLLGGVFAVTFGTVETLSPGSFQDIMTPGKPLAWQQLLYYSYVTIATLGYGDVLPVAPWARSLAILETVAGTLYLATIIARLVGAYANRPVSREPARSASRGRGTPGRGG